MENTCKYLKDKIYENCKECHLKNNLKYNFCCLLYCCEFEVCKNCDVYINAKNLMKNK